MGSTSCMNEACRATTSPQWKMGWVLKSGGLATLCFSCGSAYENSIFCETFHLEESGWRECKICAKRIHCGCIASKFLHDYLDLGGVGCLSCIRCSRSQLTRRTHIQSDDTYGRHGTVAAICDPQSLVIENRMDGNSVGRSKLMQLAKTIEENQSNGSNLFLQSQKGNPNSSSMQQIKREENMLPAGEVGTGFPHLPQQSGQSSILSKADGNRPALGLQDMYESLAMQSLNFSFSSPPNSVLPVPGKVVEGRENNNFPPPFQQGQRTRNILPKPSKSGRGMVSQGTKGVVSQMRVARPPVEGRGRHQLLPRYWPKITDQELQKISGDLKSPIVPLFEKVLSASDAGRIGRLVLPKACAEAYFPAINQSDGVPIRMKDITGKEWTFQFRFWPNNNSRMYVLEGVTPCIQNMQLEAGDTVTFGRIEPEGKLVMGCRKASCPVGMQETQSSTLFSGGPSGVKEDLVLPTEETFGWRKNEEHGNGEQMVVIPEKKKSRNIGSKSKRLLMHSEDVIELRITWGEAQELLHPPPNVNPTIVMVENHEFEEYDEPPVIGKRTIFTARESGKLEQWAQCDSCSKWRRLPVDILLSAKWACSDNIWDSNRRSCSAPDEIDPKKLENCSRGTKDFKKRRLTENRFAPEECEGASGLDALATAAVLGGHVEDDSGGVSTTTTTRHPRHRAGCTCIVCIQPPSGKGKHKPTCICNVCMTVKRRFNTLMLNKKKQKEREALHVDREKEGRVEAEVEEETCEHDATLLESERGGIESSSGSKGGHNLDLNCDPPNHVRQEDDDVHHNHGGSSTVPTEMYKRRRHNGSGPNFGRCLLSKLVVGEGEEGTPDHLPPADDGPTFLLTSTTMDVEQQQEEKEGHVNYCYTTVSVCL